MKKANISLFCLLVLVGLSGCSKDQTKEIDAMKTKIKELEDQNKVLNESLAVLENQDFENKFRDGEFDCHNLYGIQKVKFLSSRVVYIYGVDETGVVAYNNYYVLNLVEKDKYMLVDEVVLPDSMPKRTIEFLRNEWKTGFKYMDKFNILDNGQTLTIANEPLEVCSYVKSN